MEATKKRATLYVIKASMGSLGTIFSLGTEIINQAIGLKRTKIDIACSPVALIKRDVNRHLGIYSKLITNQPNYINGSNNDDNDNNEDDNDVMMMEMMKMMMVMMMTMIMIIMMMMMMMMV